MLRRGLASCLYLIRHGKTRLNRATGDSQDRIRGWKDVPLTPEGEAEAHRMADVVARLRLTGLVSSDLSRTEKTARIIAQATGVPYLGAHREFRPWNLGRFQGERSGEVAPKLRPYVTTYPDAPVPGGESFEQFQQRAWGALLQVLDDVEREDAGPVGIVTHYRVLKLAQATLGARQRGQTFSAIFFHDDLATGAILRVCRVGGRLTAELVEARA